ncbi:MAG: AAA family ATPase [Candidatus Eisenbacteria bacterium]
MYERQFGLRENPFAAGHQSKYVYPSREHQEALAHLRFGIENREAFVLITGEVGTGKTTALYDALSEWKSRAVVALITNTALTRSELYEEICMRFGVPISGPTSKPQLIQQLERHLLVVRARGDYAILLIDEAQNLDSGLLEETRLLSNLEAQGQKLLQIFLVGQPELEEKLAQPDLRQLRQRIAVHYRLQPLSVDDTEHYIHHRITVAGGHALTIFPSDACAEVHAATHGIPREINTVAAQALLNAFVEDATSVRPEHVRAIVRDTGFQSVLEAPTARAASIPAVAAPTTPPTSISPPAAASPVPVSPPHDAPAHIREVRQVPAPAPAVQRETGAAPPTPIEPEGHTMAGVRPAGSTESWQSWMQSLANMPAEPIEDATGAEANAPDAATTNNEAGPPSLSGTSDVRPEMTPEEFYAVEEAALRVPIGDDEFEDVIGEENVEGPSDLDGEFGDEVEPEVQEAGSKAPGDEATWLDELANAERETTVRPVQSEAALASAAEPDNRPGLQWGDAASRANVPVEPVAPMEPARMESPAPPMPAPWVPAATRPEPAVTRTEPVIARPEPAVTRPEPVTARVSAIPAQPMPTTRALPIRLRERLDAAEREEASDSGRMTGWLIGIAAIAVVAIGVFLALKFRGQTTEPRAAQPVVAPTTTTDTVSGETPSSGVAGTPPTSTPSGSTTSELSPGKKAMAPPAQKPPAGTSAAAVKPPAVKPAASSGGTTAQQPVAAKPEVSAPRPPRNTVPAVAAPVAPKAAVAKPAAPKTQYGVTVASYLAEDRAKTELARLTASTGVAGRVITTPDGDYRVVLGAYPDRAAAENAAGSLIDSGKVDEARVVSLGSAAKK